MSNIQTLLKTRELYSHINNRYPLIPTQYSQNATKIQNLEIVAIGRKIPLEIGPQ